ncbi:MAG: hypothetical protein IKI04_02560, partial [Bacilli bacterium]|nr:hypothetical protein [Bacilli bacterium]
YSFGYAESDGETPGNWTTASSTATKSISATEYVGQRWYSCRVYASDGTNTSATVTSATASDTEMTINNATLTFDATTNGGTGGGTVYTKTGATGVYTGIRNETAGTIPTAVPATGYELNGWYTLATGGDKVLNADGTFTGTAVSEYTTASAWATTTNKTLYAQYTSQNPTSCSSFENDSWATIVSNVQSGNTSRYPVGCTKSVDLGNSLGTHTLRVSNNSTPSDCALLPSQTACGFVLEFSDIITTHVMNSSRTAVGGWPASEMRTYVNSDIYNALPVALRNGIIDTTVVSGYETSAANQTNYVSTDKLYLLSTAEIYGEAYSSSDTVTTDYTRQLDYYANLLVTKDNNTGVVNKSGGDVTRWWLRSPIAVAAIGYFWATYDSGSNTSRAASFTANDSYGVSPAFRIGSSFATDSWETIIQKVQTGNVYDYNIGDTKEVDLGSLGVHTLRIANKTTTPECYNASYSQTACGFVLEFVDIITTHRMNPYEVDSLTVGYNANGGWPSSEMRTYVNSDIYNALPSSLRAGIINTFVVSGHEEGPTTNYTSTDKLYLLSNVEIYGENYTYDSVTTNDTRQLDYYLGKGVTSTSYSEVIKKNGTTNTDWWLRSAHNSGQTSFRKVANNGSGNTGNGSAGVLGVSPAFRLGTAASFENDTWETIVSNVQNGNTGNYHVGDEKRINLEGLGTHTLRIANMSTPSECSSSTYSQTACGFVVEFVDLITTRAMYSSSSNVGGWPSTTMRTYVNGTIYNSLPESLRNGIINTRVMSGHGSTSGEGNWISIDSLYLLSYVEIYGANLTYDTITLNETRQLDYYSDKVTPSTYSGAIKRNGFAFSEWWMRSAGSNGTTGYNYVESTGQRSNGTATNEKGVSPAFRIGRSFKTDSWEEIAANVQSGNIDHYYVGDTKQVDMGSLGVHTLRIANMSTPSACEGSDYSQTACGFVLEFADLIGTRAMHSSATNVGGWPGTTMRTYVNSTIYDALPAALKNVISSTKVISGHGSTSGEANFTSADKLYLLSMVEVYGANYTYDSLQTTQTRQLDYYSQIGVTTSSYSGAIKKNGTTNTAWRLRSPRSNNTTYYDYISNAGARTNGSATTAYGVSPAFRIGVSAFQYDSWETIVNNVQTGHADIYQVGDTKEVDLGSLGTHVLRVSNNSTPEECSQTGFSQTACGFVLEFEDIITKHRMKAGDDTTGGWPATELRTYLNTTLYDALPTAIKNGIIDTYAVSGFGCITQATNGLCHISDNAYDNNGQ